MVFLIGEGVGGFLGELLLKKKRYSSESQMMAQSIARESSFNAKSIW